MMEGTSRELSKLPGRAWIVYAVIEQAHNKGRKFSKLAALAAEAGVSLNTARRALDDLKHGGFIRHPRGYPHRAEPLRDQYAPPPASHSKRTRSATKRRAA